MCYWWRSCAHTGGFEASLATQLAAVSRSGVDGDVRAKLNSAMLRAAPAGGGPGWDAVNVRGAGWVEMTGETRDCSSGGGSSGERSASVTKADESSITDPGYMSRKTEKFRTDEFDTLLFGCDLECY